MAKKHFTPLAAIKLMAFKNHNDAMGWWLKKVFSLSLTVSAGITSQSLFLSLSLTLTCERKRKTDRQKKNTQL